jgi:hypothetical protein
MEDYNFELGWGFYLLVLPLIVMLTIQILIKPNLEKLNTMVYILKRKVLEHDKILSALKKWMK